MSSERDRVISISLTEAEWQAFIALQPKPVDWLRARILDEVQSAPRAAQRLTLFSHQTSAGSSHNQE
jgi:hypothetical protein